MKRKNKSAVREWLRITRLPLILFFALAVALTALIANSWYLIKIMERYNQ